TTVLDLDVVRNAPLSREPYSYFMGSGFLRPDSVDELRRTFPAITKPGFLTSAIARACAIAVGLTLPAFKPRGGSPP
ncbi:MAG: hypothetical protein ACJ8CX_22595, partial [Microvirga sp.]